MTPAQLTQLLRQTGCLRGGQPRITPLAGGVSSDILLVEDGGRRFVVKFALPQLRVKDEWLADVSRNRHEQDYIDYVSRLAPGAVPRILHRAPEHGFFTMEYLGEGFENWKSQLLAGRLDVATAQAAAKLLGTIHRASWGDAALRKKFATDRTFFELRIEPYLLTTGRRHPALQSHFEAEAARLAATHLCLVHGDYSPKNMLISPSRLVLLDCEVAWFGDPVFDIAFLLNHLMLKSIHLPARAAELKAMMAAAWDAYLSELTPSQRDGLEPRTARLLLMLMLARVDGKSPVEYLGDGQRAWVRELVGRGLERVAATVAEVAGL